MKILHGKYLLCLSLLQLGGLKGMKYLLHDVLCLTVGCSFGLVELTFPKVGVARGLPFVQFMV